MYLNDFASGSHPLDMTALQEFASLLRSAQDLGIPHPPDVRYLSRNVVLRHQRFHFLEWGDPQAEPILLLHGGNQSAHSWDLVSLHLSDRYHVLALDQRGHGDSEWNRGADYSIAAMAEDAQAFIAELGLERPIVFGHSMGGMVTLALATSRPELARALVVVDVGPQISEDGTRMIRDFVHRNIEFDDLEEFLDAVEKYDPYRTRSHMERTIKYNLLKRADGRYISKVDRRRFLHQDEAERTRSLGVPRLEAMSRIPCPTLVVRGGNSKVLEAEPAERFRAALPVGQLVTVPDCGHNVQSQNTPGFLDAIGPFLETI
jgi:pimeloyl-ACP methyl ester carboxylesterase